MIDTPDFWSMVENYGVYAFKAALIDGKEAILVSDCVKFIITPECEIWYVPKSDKNPIPIVERWIYIPRSGILAIAFNDKLITK